MSGAIPPLPIYAFRVCKENSSFTFVAQSSVSEIESLNVKSGSVFNMLILKASMTLLRYKMHFSTHDSYRSKNQHEDLIFL